MLRPLPAVTPPRRPPLAFARGLPARSALGWLVAGWRDLRAAPGPGLAWGALVFLLSVGVIAGLWRLGLLYLALPAASGFLIVGPFLAIGLYEQSRRLAAGEAAGFRAMLAVRPAAGAQLAHAGLLLGLLVLFWLRAADLLYALFFGLMPFPGAAEALGNLLTTPQGWGLLAVGTVIGAVFAGFAFAISLFAIPMMLERRVDALTAMGLSLAMTAQNLPVALAWGAIVVAGLALSLATGFLALIVVFPVLGHGTWHVWRAISADRAS